MNILINISACALGSYIGYKTQPNDFMANFWGIALMLAIAFAITEHNLWYLMITPIFTLLLYERGK